MSWVWFWSVSVYYELLANQKKRDIHLEWSVLAFLGKHVSLLLRPADFLEIIYYEVIIGVLSTVIITGKDKLSPW